MAQFINQLQERVKTSSSQLFLFILKFLSCSFIGLTLALIGRELLGYGTFSFFLVILVVTFALLRILKFWGWGKVLVFDLICVLVALLLRMYILVAPGV